MLRGAEGGPEGKREPTLNLFLHHHTEKDEYVHLLYQRLCRAMLLLLLYLCVTKADHLFTCFNTNSILKTF